MECPKIYVCRIRIRIRKKFLWIRIRKKSFRIHNTGYIRYNSDPVAPHSAITGIADVGLRYHTICSGHHIFLTRPSYKFIKPLRNVYLNLKSQGSLN
jgi:hypothetical protein